MPNDRCLATAIVAGGSARRLGGVNRRALAIDDDSILARNVPTGVAREERWAARPPEHVRLVEIGPEEVAVFDPHGLLVVNVNTPHDYERARRMSAQRHND